MRSLPLLEARRRELELCVYCPKLCRAACPVSNVEPRETLIPHGKMSAAFFIARGDFPRDAEHAATAWACSGCHRCTERCDHRNPVAETLDDARATFFREGLAPAAAQRISSQFTEHQAKTKDAIADLERALPNAVSKSGVTVVLGCGYARSLPEESRDAITVLNALFGPVRVASGCCGQPLRDAGDELGFRRAAHAFRAEIGDAKEVIAVDPGCGETIRNAYPHVGVDAPKVIALPEAVAPHLARFARTHDAPVRYHDPCKLGRGLGVYDAPRALLARVTGHAPIEHARSREQGGCSGGGGLLPVTMPDVARAIASERGSESADGVPLVTACASSLRSFRRAGTPATDLVTWLAKGLRD